MRKSDMMRLLYILGVEDAGDGSDQGGSGGNAADQGGSGENGGNASDLGLSGEFPENTKPEDMTDAQRAAYWKFQMRKTSNQLKSSVPKSKLDEVQSELDALKREQLPDAEKALEDARREALEEGRREAASKFATKLATAAVQIAVGDRISEEKLKKHLEFVDMTKFVDEDGEVLTEKVTAFAEGIAPASPPPPSRQGWKSGGSGADRDHSSRNGAHSVSSAKEERLAKLRAQQKK